MTSTEEARFIALWQQGASYREIAQVLGIPVGTVGSRAYRLVRQGKNQPRPKGGNYPRQKALVRQDDSPRRAPATPPAEAPAPHPRVDIKQ
jgi:transposase